MDEWLAGETQPLVGEIQKWRMAWYLAALDSRDAYESSIREIGLPEVQIGELLELRDHAAKEAETERPRRSPGVALEVHFRWLDRLRDWFAGRTVEVNESVDVELRVPLFIMAAAKVPGCTATFALKQSAAGGAEWGVTIFGTGLAGSALMKVSTATSFTANSGETKVVFMPAVVPIERVTFFNQGRPAGTGYRVNSGQLRATGGLGLHTSDAVPGLDRIAARYPLAGDRTGALAVYEHSYEYSRSHQLQLGAEAYGTQIGVKAKVEMSSSVVLTYSLRGGLDYELHFVVDGDGLAWGKIADPHGSQTAA